MGYLLPEGFRERTKRECNGDYMEEAPSLDNYVKFLKHYYNHIKDEYEAVCDFSTTYAGFNIHHIMTFAKTLKENFDVKVIMILRDPFRRMFSHFNHVYRDNPIEELSKAFLYIRRFDKNSFQFPLDDKGYIERTLRHLPTLTIVKYNRTGNNSLSNSCYYHGRSLGGS